MAECTVIIKRTVMLLQQPSLNKCSNRSSNHQFNVKSRRAFNKNLVLCLNDRYMRYLYFLWLETHLQRFFSLMVFVLVNNKEKGQSFQSKFEK